MDTYVDSERARLTAADFVLEENGKLKDENVRLKLQVSHWRNSANDANFMLSRIDKSGPKRYADSFYNPALQRIVNKLYKENQLLINTINEMSKDPNFITSLKEHADLKTQVQNLRSELENKYKEIRRLNQLHGDQEPFDKHLDSMNTLMKRYQTLQAENKKLRSDLILQDNVKVYMRKIVDSLRRDFLEIFCKCYAEEGENFLNAIKELDKNGLPDILFKPLCQDQATNTEAGNSYPGIVSNIAQMKITDTKPDGYDSGVGSLNDELQYYTRMLRESHQGLENKTAEVNRLLQTLEKKNAEINQLIQSNQSLVEKSEELNELKLSMTDYQQNRKKMSIELQNKDSRINELEEQVKAHDELVNEMLNQQSTGQENKENNKVIIDELEKDINYLNKKVHDLTEENWRLKENNKRFEDAIKTASQQTSSRTSPYRQQGYESQYAFRDYSHQKPNEPFHDPLPWNAMNIGNQSAIVVRDGPEPRDSRDSSPPLLSRPKRQSSEPSLGRSTYDYPTSSSPKRRNQPTEQESCLQCEFCGNFFPLAIIFDHTRTCKRN